jgi:hypothetical protein
LVWSLISCLECFQTYNKMTCYTLIKGIPFPNDRVSMWVREKVDFSTLSRISVGLNLIEVLRVGALTEFYHWNEDRLFHYWIKEKGYAFFAFKLLYHCTMEKTESWYHDDGRRAMMERNLERVFSINRAFSHNNLIHWNWEK